MASKLSTPFYVAAIAVAAALYFSLNDNGDGSVSPEIPTQAQNTEQGTYYRRIAEHRHAPLGASFGVLFLGIAIVRFASNPPRPPPLCLTAAP